MKGIPNKTPKHDMNILKNIQIIPEHLKERLILITKLKKYQCCLLGPRHTTRNEMSHVVHCTSFLIGSYCQAAFSLQNLLAGSIVGGIVKPYLA